MEKPNKTEFFCANIIFCHFLNTEGQGFSQENLNYLNLAKWLFVGELYITAFSKTQTNPEKM